MTMLEDLRELLNTPSLRRWFQEEFWIRTKSVFAAVPILIKHAYTSPATYEVRIVDPETGEVEEHKYTEQEIRDLYGDKVFEDAYSQLPDGGAYVNLSDYGTPLEQILDEVENDMAWGTWDSWQDEDEPN